jgi:hypothetical protein
MSQTFTDNCYDSTHKATTDLQAFENNFAALKSAFSGATQPGNTVAGMWWFDTTANILKLRNEANNAWQSVWDFANNKPVIANLSNEITGAMISSAIKNAAAGTASLRTLGTTATSACAGNDPRLGVPADLSITTAKLANDAVTNAKLADDAVKAENIYAGAVGSSELASAAVSQVNLKTAVGEGVGVGSFTLPGESYGFFPKLYMCNDVSFRGWTSYYAIIRLYELTPGYSPYFSQRYITSSGEVNWLFILRDKKTKAVKQSWYASDHPCMGNGGDPELLPHPFIDINEETDEVVVVNPTNEEVEVIKKKIPKHGSLLRTIVEHCEVDDDSDAEWTDKDVTVGLPEDSDWKVLQKDSTIKPIKRKIPKPENILCKKLKWRKK